MSDVEIVAKPPKRRWYKSLFVQVLIGIALGIATGLLFPGFSHHLAPLGEGFIKLIKMVVAPLIFLVIVTGIAKVGSMKALGRIGGQALLWFTAATTCALGLGLLVGNLVHPGSGLNIDPATLDTTALDEKTQGGHLPGGVEFIMHIIPTSVVDAFAQNNLLQVLLFAILFGVALASFSESAPPVLMEVLDQALHVIFRDRRLHHVPGTSRRIRCHGVHRRQLRRRLAEILRNTHPGVLRSGTALHRPAVDRRQADYRRECVEVRQVLP